ncbi:unnamed protein product [Vitrella brassicaformis CCMP3155]|uniref:Uncharacterized protein n=1 Tax=Vitrella brassicaformis (strain CCMP3155) TaxID=1169540 RepID=A0A0G4ELD2_VITBC|nr:unnamed protein product [Vitrella brassicaformis CCMP3155]|eukprot:CEL97986.1 unnamed protein product [Vitrella brassicaformis CCMP3155]
MHQYGDGRSRSVLPSRPFLYFEYDPHGIVSDRKAAFEAAARNKSSPTPRNPDEWTRHKKAEQQMVEAAERDAARSRPLWHDMGDGYLQAFLRMLRERDRQYLYRRWAEWLAHFRSVHADENLVVANLRCRMQMDLDHLNHLHGAAQCSARKRRAGPHRSATPSPSRPSGGGHCDGGGMLAALDNLPHNQRKAGAIRRVEEDAKAYEEDMKLIDQVFKSLLKESCSRITCTGGKPPRHPVHHFPHAPHGLPPLQPTRSQSDTAAVSVASCSCINHNKQESSMAAVTPSLAGMSVAVLGDEWAVVDRQGGRGAFWRLLQDCVWETAGEVGRRYRWVTSSVGREVLADMMWN